METESRDSDIDILGKKRRTRPKEKCHICEQHGFLYNFYGAFCCEGCKQFFRRCILQKIEAKCPDKSDCDITKVKCRYCRYQKCLAKGMDPKFMKIKQADKHELFIESLKQIERAFKRIWDSSRPLPEAYTNRHQTLAGLLQDKHNLLSKADQFPDELIGWNKAQFLHEVEMNGMFSMHAMTVHVINDLFLTAEMAKTLPFFKQLDMNDQCCLLRHVGQSTVFLFNAFYSHAIGAKCVTRRNGMTSTAILEAKQIRQDQKIRSIFTQSACRLVEMMSEAGVEYDEFILMLLIIFSNSTSDGLSPGGRELLYNESIHYSKSLHKLLQFKFGFFGGSQKFAALMNVLNYAIGCKYNFGQIHVYIEVFYEKHDLKAAFPSVIPAFFEF